ncbi:MAG TPA: type II secretion system F family protein [Verrucomicrobiae bacterium]|nr:type II secretion system F family protein [Verrucomicrobiae bacterium]
MVQNYNYRARNKENQVVGGIVQAVSVEAAKKMLQKNELTPISITIPKTVADFLPFLNRVTLNDRTLFSRQLATMIEAGLTLSQSMRLLIRQARKGKFRDVMEGVLNDIQDGFSFSSALAKYNDVFDPVFINVVRSGEATGKLENVLSQLSTNMEKDVKIRGKIKGALVYPAFIMVAMVGVGVVMMVKVIPQLRDLFLSSGKELPLSTRTLIAVSDFLIHRWYLVILILVVGGYALRAFLQSEAGVRFFSKFSLRIPVMGKIVEETNMARFGRLLSLLLSSGVPLLEALRLINDSFTNRLYQRGIQIVAEQVERGIPMSTPISDNPIFPLMVGQMVSVGEQTGKMDEVMIKLAEYYEAEVDSKVSGLSSLIEPIVIIILGIGVAGLVVSILLPIYQISTSV